MRKCHEVQRSFFIQHCDNFSLFLIPPYASFPHSEAVPPDVLELLPDGYVYADYPGVFDDVEGGGLTFETWIYMTERPKERPNGLVAHGQ